MESGACGGACWGATVALGTSGGPEREAVHVHKDIRSFISLLSTCRVLGAVGELGLGEEGYRASPSESRGLVEEPGVRTGGQCCERARQRPRGLHVPSVTVSFVSV